MIGIKSEDQENFLDPRFACMKQSIFNNYRNRLRIQQTPAKFFPQSQQMLLRKIL